MEYKNKKINKPLAFAALAATVFFALFLIWQSNQNSKKIVENLEKEATSSKIGEINEGNTKIFFASDGKNKVYKIKKENKWAVIWNNKEGKLYDFVSNPVFNSDGTQLAYSAELEGQHFVVLNNEQEFSGYDYVLDIYFDENNELVYKSKRGDEIITIIDQEIVDVVPFDGTYPENQENPNSPSQDQENENPTDPSEDETPKNKIYRYRKSTDKDVVFPEDQLDYDACPEGADCNF